MRRKGVHNVHTLGVGSGRTGPGLGRMGDVFGGLADVQGPEPGLSPTSGTYYPSSEGLCLNVWISGTAGPGGRSSRRQ